MSYQAQATLSYDGEFINRVAACAAEEIPKTHKPQVWAADHIWWIAAAPGFSESYGYALETGVEHPGADPAVITDAQILGAVQALRTELETT